MITGERISRNARANQVSGRVFFMYDSRKLMTEMEDRIEEKYGIGCHLISPTDDLAEDMLKRGKEIHASN